MNLPASLAKKGTKEAYVTGFTISILHVGKLRP